jgi:D-proline reductase (dithiol) PrdB
VEKRGLATITISMAKEFTEQVKMPRVLYIRFPYGHPLGEPGNRDMQRSVLMEALKALSSIREPGTTIEAPFQWRKG